jgi:ABC-type multidrug transport system fused ATPase/permease subunit
MRSAEINLRHEASFGKTPTTRVLLRISLLIHSRINLSEGQKQRLSLARALVKDPDILVLDEPTSALDSLVEKSIFDALPDFIRGKTLFVVAHRLYTVKKANRILLLYEKRLVSTGTHNELMETSPYYRSLVENQQILTD